MKLYPPKSLYSHGWGKTNLGTKTIICLWSLLVKNLPKVFPELSSDLFEGERHRIIISDNKKLRGNLLQQSPVFNKNYKVQSSEKKTISTFISSGRKGNFILWLELFPQENFTVQSSLSGVIQKADVNPAKTFHNFPPSILSIQVNFCQKVDIKRPDWLCLTKCFSVVKNLHTIETAQRRRKITLRRVNEEWNQELRADLIGVKLRNEENEIWTGVVIETAYGECAITSSKNIEMSNRTFEKIWTHCNESTEIYRGSRVDPELCKVVLEIFLKSHESNFSTTFQIFPWKRKGKKK